MCTTETDFAATGPLAVLAAKHAEDVADDILAPAAASVHAPTARLRAPRVRHGRRGIRTIPICRPFPYISGHVEHTERARTLREAAHRGRRLPAVAGVVHRRPVL